ncbi:MAG: ADP-ribosylation factor-like protein [Candidatus Hodarchaeota archaeon]
MGFFRKFFSGKAPEKKEGKIVLLGASEAGKTTLVRYLETGKPVESDVKTTLGIDLRKTSIKIDGWSFKAIDVGGQELYQKTFWALGVRQADAVIYIIDGTTKANGENAKWETSRFQFDYMLKLVDQDIPLLILVNKQDLTELNPLTAEEIIDLYDIKNLLDRSLAVLPTSAKYGDGVQTSMEWLAEKIDENN